MASQYSDSAPDIDRHRWYFTKFSIERYRHEKDWDEVLETFDRTAEAVRTLLEAYRSAGVFGDSELTALKSTTQLPETIGPEATRRQILDTGGDRDLLERAAGLVDENTGIVTGVPYPASVEDDVSNVALDLFETLLEEDLDPEPINTAAEQLLDLEFDNVGGGTLTAVFCLLHPTHFPLINAQTKGVFDSLFDIRLSADPNSYLNSMNQFESVRQEFGFDEHYRHLDNFCYWLRSEVAVGDSPVPENMRGRLVWQIDTGRLDQIEAEQLWQSWQELEVCSMEWDIGPLDELTSTEIEDRAEQFEDSQAGTCLRHFVEDMEPGQLIIAKDGAHLLGIGVTQRGGYQHTAELDSTAIEDIPHVNLWPVEWVVTPELDIGRDASQWDVNPSLLPHETPLVGTDAFEGIRWELAQRAPDLISDLSTLEQLVADPPTSDLFHGGTAAGHFILQTGSDEWEDEPSERYHFRMGLPGSRNLWEAGSGSVAFLEDGELYAAAHINEISQEHRDDEVHYFADIEGYEELEPVDVQSVQAEFETSISLQHPIIQISEDDYQEIVETGRNKRYFWVNTGIEDWQHEGGELFCSATNKNGSERLNQEGFERASPGDEVLVYQMSPMQQVVGLGRVIEGLHEEYSEYLDRRAEGITIAWEESIEGASWDTVKSDPELANCAVVSSDNNYYLGNLTEEEFDRILELGHRTTFSDHADDLKVAAGEITIELGNLHFPDGEWQRIRNRIQQALSDGNHVLLFGPPGTGKTKLARQVCAETVGVDDYELVTASADWSTFDTVGGYQTTSANKLEFEPGIVLDRFHADADGTPSNEWLVIDELNRADIDKAFGSLFSALTGESVTLPFNGSDGDPIEILDASRRDEEIGPNRYFIPQDWRMLATMNTLDKTSLYEMSYAFMRRWAFIPVGIPELPGPAEDPAEGPSELAGLIESYVDVWATEGDVPQTPAHYEPIGQIWRAVNEQRAIGPAIVEDIYQYIASAPSSATADYVSPIIMYVFPQLEGLRRGELERLVGTLEEIIDDESGELWSVARDFFQMDLGPDSER